MSIHDQPITNLPQKSNEPEVTAPIETTPTVSDEGDFEYTGPTPSQHQAPKHKDRDGLKNILSTLAILIVAPLIALSLTAFVFQSYEVDGPSMETTLQNQDRLIVVKVPRTWARITGHDYIPNRGDVVIFVKQDLIEYGSTEKKQLIKRVIALPGERVVVKNNVVTVYNNDHPNGFQPDKTLPYGGVIPKTSGNIDLTVPKGQIFVCGDNRPNSLDSRAFGTVPANDIVGKLGMRIFPFNKAKAF